MEATNKRRENLSWPDQDKVNAQLEAIRELAKELRTDYPTDTDDADTNCRNKAMNRRNGIIREQFVEGYTPYFVTGKIWLELFDFIGFNVDKETRKRFASHLNCYYFWIADFQPRLSSKYAQRIHWYVQNSLFCLRNKLQTEKEYREGKYGSKGQAYFKEIEEQPATPTETPQISTETAEAVNVSAEGDKAAERAENKPERKIKYFHYTPEQLKRYIIDVYDKRANGEWVLDHQEDTDNGYYDVLDGKVIYWHDKRANRFSFYNMDFNSPTCGRCFRINSTYQKEKYVVSNEILMEFLMGDTYRNIHKQTVYNNGKYEHYYTIQDRYGNFNVGNFSYTFDGIMQRFNDDYKDYATIIWQSPEFAPQSPETPQTVECTAEAYKLAQTA